MIQINIPEGTRSSDTGTEQHPPPIHIGPGAPLAVFCGPCVIESEESIFDHASAIQKIAIELQMPLIFKASYDKANRTSGKSFRGLGMEQGLELLARVRQQFEVPVITDVHDVHDVDRVAAVVDVLQIPAFLCRQTDLLVGAARSGKPILVKKGQFVAPGDMRYAVEKMKEAGNSQVMLCERGSCFGYRELVVDFRSLQIMAETGCPVVFDATHSVQIMGGAGGTSEGNRAWVPLLARAAVAVGIDAIFLECHRNPDSAPSDGPNMVALSKLKGLLSTLKRFHELRVETATE